MKYVIQIKAIDLCFWHELSIGHCIYFKFARMRPIEHSRRMRVIFLTVRAVEAYNDGVQFYKEEKDIWLADAIPSNYIFL